MQRGGAGYLGIQGISAEAMAGPGHHACPCKRALPEQEAFSEHGTRTAMLCCKVADASRRCCPGFCSDRTHAGAMLEDSDRLTPSRSGRPGLNSKVAVITTSRQGKALQDSKLQHRRQYMVQGAWQHGYSADRPSCPQSINAKQSIKPSQSQIAQSNPWQNNVWVAPEIH